jgi:uncharacterized protein (TIGR02246 family)
MYGRSFADEPTASPGPTASPEQSADDAAIRATSQAFARAFEKGDAKAVADFWTQEGEYIDEGKDPIHGRAALMKSYEGFFAKRPNLKVDATTDKIRFLGKNTAIEEGAFSVKTADSPPQTSRYSTLYVRENGGWHFALIKEWDDPGSRATLQDLAWLIGNWKSEGPDGEVRTSYEWADGKKFIRARYSITSKAKPDWDTSGTQMIGVDPSSGSIRVWTFSSDGGIGDAVWTWDGDRWNIESTGFSGSGEETTATNLMTPSGKNEFTWRSVKRTVGDQELDDLPSVKVNRVK